MLGVGAVVGVEQHQHLRPARYDRWGEQLDVRNITRGDGKAGELSAEQEASYIAKYAPGGLRSSDLRHTCASLLIAQGASVKAVQAQLGTRPPASRWTPTGTCSRLRWTPSGTAWSWSGMRL
jgi:integrase